MSGYPTGLGDYEFRGILGSGVSGTVYAAHQSLIDRDVAVKELSAELTAQPAFRERFRAEAEIMARLDNDHCVRVFDYFERQDNAYLVTELVSGASLRKVVESGARLSPEQALGVLKGSLLGLEHAHGMGLLHRDIKPENVLLDTEGTSKLADFGLAGAIEGPGAASGIPMGSPAYMSPEVVAGSAVDARSDLYSAAAVLFELLTGRPPFVADGPLAVMRMQREAAVPDPRELNPDLGPGMAGLVMGGLAKDPAQRPQTAGQMLGALETTAAEAYGADWESRSSMKREVAAAVGAGLGLLALLATAGAIAATGAVGSAVTAAAASAGGTTVAGGVLGLSTSVIAAGVAAVLLAGGGIFVLASGTLGSKPPVAIASPTPSPSVLLSPSPDVSPSPSDSPSPSPSPSPSIAPTVVPHPAVTTTIRAATPPPPPPKPGPITINNLGMWFTTTNAGDICHTGCDAAKYTPGRPPYQAGQCGQTSPGAVTLTFYEQYDWSFPGTTGTSQPVTIAYSGTRQTNSGPQNLNASPPSTPAVASGESGSHAHGSPATFSIAPYPGNTGPGGGQLTFTLRWINPNTGLSDSKTLPYTFLYNCG